MDITMNISNLAIGTVIATGAALPILWLVALALFKRAAGRPSRTQSPLPSIIDLASPSGSARRKISPTIVPTVDALSLADLKHQITNIRWPINH